MRKSYFTIVELLTVVAIFGILISLISPALNKTVLKSQQVTCKNNLKQIGMLTFAYADSHDDRMPPGVRHWGPGYWIEVLQELNTNQTISRTSFDPKGTIFECPTVDKISIGLPTYMQGGYGYNHAAGILARPPRVPEYLDSTIRISSITIPQETTALADDKTNNNTGPGYLHAAVLNYNRSLSHPRNRHQLYANYFWMDGHVSQYLLEDFANEGEAKGSKDWYLMMQK